jgi:hypothetical protein
MPQFLFWGPFPLAFPVAPYKLPIYPVYHRSKDGTCCVMRQPLCRFFYQSQQAVQFQQESRRHVAMQLTNLAPTHRSDSCCVTSIKVTLQIVMLFGLVFGRGSFSAVSAVQLKFVSCDFKFSCRLLSWAMEVNVRIDVRFGNGLHN